MTGGNGVTLAYYKVKFVLPSLDSALSTIIKHLLKPKLLSLYPDFTDYRTHELTEVKLVGDSPDASILRIPVEKMSFEQLSDLCVLRVLLCDPYKYSSIMEARVAVAEALRLKNEEAESLARVDEENAEKNKLLELNQMDPKEVSRTVDLGVGVAPIPVKNIQGVSIGDLE